MTIAFYDRPRSAAEALVALPPGAGASFEHRMYIAGGTELVPLMRAGIVEPRHLVDLRFSGLPSTVEPRAGGGIVVGAAATMSAVAADRRVREQYPVLADALLASASPQVRNAATIGGNLLQRTRCSFFRDTSFPCNKRQPGSGCPAQDVEFSRNAILGAGSACVAVHASDCAVALIALDARVHLLSPSGERQIPLSELYVDPGSTPWRETTLAERELIVAVECPVPAPHSAYVKVRDRASFEFSLVSAAAVVGSSTGGRSQIALALGGVAPRPWRLSDAEAAIAGRPFTRAAIEKAVEASLSTARAVPGNAFKIPLARHAAVRAAAMAGGLV